MTNHNPPRRPLRLSAPHQRTYEAIFRHPTAPDIAWHDVRSLLDAVADVVEGRNGAITVTRNEQSVSFHIPEHKTSATAEDVLAARWFLALLGAPALSVPAAEASPARGALDAHLLVVIDHHEARVYHAELHGGVPERLVPYDPHGFGKYLRPRNEDADGKRRPEQKSYYEAIAATLRGATRVLIFGSGTGKSSAMGHLLTDLRENHPDVFERVVGSVVVDAHHTTEGQLLAHARALFSGAGA